MERDEAIEWVERWAAASAPSLAGVPWASRPFRGGCYLYPSEPRFVDLVGFGGVIVRDGGEVVSLGSYWPPEWWIGHYLADDQPDRRTEAEARAAARAWWAEQGGVEEGRAVTDGTDAWVGQRFAGGWLFAPPGGAQAESYLVVFDHGEVRAEPGTLAPDSVAARCAAEVAFGSSGPPG